MEKLTGWLAVGIFNGGEVKDFFWNKYQAQNWAGYYQNSKLYRCRLVKIKKKGERSKY